MPRVREEIKMTRYKFAVVREARAPTYPYSFTCWHDSQEDAEKEAERLARKEQAKFFILKLIGKFEPDERPIKREVWG